ncbi:hypothetical protein ACFPM0_12100 [Pseudonocardia sulfidoxydans]
MTPVSRARVTSTVTARRAAREGENPRARRRDQPMVTTAVGPSTR